MGCLVHHCRDKGNGCRSTTNDDHTLAAVVEILRPQLGMYYLALKVLFTWKIRLVTFVVIVIAGTNHQEIAGIVSGLAAFFTQ